MNTAWNNSIMFGRSSVWLVSCAQRELRIVYYTCTMYMVSAGEGGVPIVSNLAILPLAIPKDAMIMAKIAEE